MNHINIYPDHPGVYWANNGKHVYLIEVAGWYPNIYVKRGIKVDSFFNSEVSAKSISILTKPELEGMLIDTLSWNFREIDASTIAPMFSTGIGLSMTEEDFADFRRLYAEIKAVGLSYTRMIGVIRNRLNCTEEKALNIINQLDACMNKA